jgi:hypothetical protein
MNLPLIADIDLSSQASSMAKRAKWIIAFPRAMPLAINTDRGG